MADIPLDRMLQAAGVLDEDFKPITDDKVRLELSDIYKDIIYTLKYYCGLDEKHYTFLAVWSIGAVNIQKFNTYPYLFINAMKGSGKTRLLKLMAKITGGDVLNSLKEAVLFRTKGTLAIDEFEGVNRKGNEELKELLNSAYKKGVKVKRMRKVKAFDGEQQVVEEFEVYRPIIMANIWGMDEVLGDRCVKIVLDKSNNPNITKKIEDFNTNPTLQTLVCRLCHVGCFCNIYSGIERAWNYYISNKYPTQQTLHTLLTQPTQPTQEEINILENIKKVEENFLDFFNKIDESNLDGRTLELTFPLLFIASFLGEDVFNELLETFKEMDKEKKDENIIESYDVSFIDFVSQEKDENYWISLKDLVRKFKEFLQIDKEWINEEWIGRTLKRLNLAKEKRRKTRGREVILNILKAQEKIRMFK